MKQIILMSIRPEWVAKILNGEKTIEVRKHALEEGDEVHIYCTKGKETNRLIDFDKFAEVEKDNRFHYVDLKISSSRLAFMPYLNGKVVAKFIVGKVEEINVAKGYMGLDASYSIHMNDMCKKACLNDNDLRTYACMKPLFFLEITQLEIFDKPRELGEYKTKQEVCIDYDTKYKIGLFPITHAPQSWQKAWVDE